MTLPLPRPTSEPLPPRRRWGRVVLLVLLAGFGALGWHIYTGQRAVRQLREAGIELVPRDIWLGARLWDAVRMDWRRLFQARVWERQPDEWQVAGAKASELRNLDALATALRRVAPETLDLSFCAALQNVDGLKGLAGLRMLFLGHCAALQNVDGMKGLTGLVSLDLDGCATLQNVVGLKGLTGLQELSLSNCRALQSVDGLQGLTDLQMLDLSGCLALHNVDGLKGLTGLRDLSLIGCIALQNVDGLKGLAGLQQLILKGCARIPAPAFRELRAALPSTSIIFPDGTSLPPQ